ncbi:MAG: hypothetical protein IKX00_04340 [Bacilli bacterium]|nr:hypothetical protein [Bacilli bacterium]
MNHRENEITLFLKNAYKIKEYNKNKFSVKDVYLMLLSYDLDLDEFNISYDDNYFSYFTEFYKDNKNLNISQETDKDNYFIISNINNHNNLIKLNLNVTPDKYFTVLSKLIGYLSEHDEIKHYSKISKCSRNDQIILGFLRKDDLLKVIEFINSNNTIYDNLRLSHPFFIHYDKNGICFDFNLDYTHVISYLIYKYFENKYDINSIKADDFVYFVRKIYNELINIESLKFYNDFINSELLDNVSNDDINTYISNYLYIFEEFSRLYEDDSLDLCYKLFEYSGLEKENNDRSKYLSKKYDLIKIKETVDSYIKFAYSKYNDVDEISRRLSDFAKDSISDKEYALRYITREHDYRELFKNISSDDIYRITNNDIYSYVDNILKLV